MDGLPNTRADVLRTAREDDIPALRRLVERSFRTLGTPHYSAAAIDAAAGGIIRVDPELVHQGTYFVVERGGELTGCGGWSDRVQTIEGLPFPARHAEVRAMFVAPGHEGTGVGRTLLHAAERAIATAGYDRAYLVATMSGRAFYLRAGYRVLGEHVAMLAGGVELPLTCMERSVG